MTSKKTISFKLPVDDDWLEAAKKWANAQPDTSTFPGVPGIRSNKNKNQIPGIMIDKNGNKEAGQIEIPPGSPASDVINELKNQLNKGESK